MPFLPDSTPLEICWIPRCSSRMNIRQILEVHLGLAAKAKGWHIATPVFDSASEIDIMDTLELAEMSRDGKMIIYDGRTGEPLVVRLRWIYVLPQAYLVDDRIRDHRTLFMVAAPGRKGPVRRSAFR